MYTYKKYLDFQVYTVAFGYYKNIEGIYTYLNIIILGCLDVTYMG